MANTEELVQWFQGKLEASGTLTALLASVAVAGGSEPAIYEEDPGIAAAFPCVIHEPLLMDIAETQDQDTDKNVVWRFQLSAYAKNTESYYAKTRLEAIYAAIDAAVLDLPLRETCSTTNWRIEMIRRSGARFLAGGDEEHQLSADWWLKAIRKS